MGKRRVSPVEAQVAIPKTVDAEAKKALKRKLDSRPIRVTTRSSLRGFASAATNADDDAPPDPCPLSALPSPKSRFFFGSPLTMVAKFQNLRSAGPKTRWWAAAYVPRCLK